MTKQLRHPIETLPEPMRDPNPFHHAAALVQKMDRLDLEALAVVIADRKEQLTKRNLKWVSQDGGFAIANGKRGVYRIMAFSRDNARHFCLAIMHRDDNGALTHIETSSCREHLKARAEDYDTKVWE